MDRARRAPAESARLPRFVSLFRADRGAARGASGPRGRRRTDGRRARPGCGWCAAARRRPPAPAGRARGGRRPVRSAASGCRPCRRTAAGRCRRAPRLVTPTRPSTSVIARPTSSISGCASSIRPLANWPPGQERCTGWSRSHGSRAQASWIARAKAARASSGCSPSCTPSRPSATRTSGTLLAQSPVRTVPIEIG